MRGLYMCAYGCWEGSRERTKAINDRERLCQAARTAPERRKDTAFTPRKANFVRAHLVEQLNNFRETALFSTKSKKELWRSHPQRTSRILSSFAIPEKHGRHHLGIWQRKP